MCSVSCSTRLLSQAPRRLNSTFSMGCTKTRAKGYQSRSSQHKIFLPSDEKESLKSLAKDLNLTAKETIRVALIWMVNSIRRGSITTLTDSPLRSNKEIRKILHKERVAKGPDYAPKDISALTQANKKAYEEGETRNLESVNQEYHSIQATLLEANRVSLAGFFDECGELDLDSVRQYQMIMEGEEPPTDREEYIEWFMEQPGDFTREEAEAAWEELYGDKEEDLPEGFLEELLANSARAVEEGRNAAPIQVQLPHYLQDHKSEERQQTDDWTLEETDSDISSWGC